MLQHSVLSHCSTPVRTKPSPQVAGWHPTHASLVSKLPSSQTSPSRRFTSPSPHSLTVQSASQSALGRPPASQSSSNSLSATPSPQTGSVQSSRHALGSLSLLASPSSHSSVPLLLLTPS